jgi:AAA domain
MTEDPWGGFNTVEMAEREAPPAAVATWLPVDLSSYLDGTHKPSVPTLLARTDGICLLYPGLIHSLHGESESGKSLVAQHLAAQQVMAGNPVLFIDFESDAATVTERLLMLSATPKAITEHFHYIRPEVDPRSLTELPAWHAMLEQSYALAVIDGVTDSLGVFGYSTKDNDEVAAWMRVLPKNIATRTGAAVTVIDHVTKDNDSRGRFAIGAQAKMSGLTGASYTVEVAEALGRGLRGVIVLRVGKDRPGYVRGESGPMRKSDRTQETARITVDSTVDPDHPVVTVEPWRGSDGSPVVSRSFRPTALMERVSEALEAAGEPLSRRQLEDHVTGKKEHVTIAAGVLVADGYISREDGPRNAVLHRLVTTYRQRQDPLSDLYQCGGTVSVPKPLFTVPHPYTGDWGTDTQPSPGDGGGTVGDGQKCGLCHTQETPPGRGICTRCANAQPSPLEHARDVS